MYPNAHKLGTVIYKDILDEEVGLKMKEREAAAAVGNSDSNTIESVASEVPPQKIASQKREIDHNDMPVTLGSCNAPITLD